MKILKTLPAIAGILFAQSVSVRGPELTMSGSTISHAKTDGNCHVPRAFGQPVGYQLTTDGTSCGFSWAAPGGAFVDSARAAKKADTANYAAVAGRADSSRVSGLSDSAKALVRYARTTAVHDTADVLRDSLARRGTESTGLWYFPAPYISIASSTTFSVAPVRGQVVNTTGSPGLTRVKIVNFAGVSGVTPASLTTTPITYLLLDSNGTLVQQATVPTLADVASNIYLGSVNHPGLTTITSVAVAPDVASRPQDQLNGLWKGIGYINRGVTAYPNGANLSLNISGGDFYGDGIGWVGNPKTPVTVPVGPYIQASMRLRTRSSTTSASTIYIDPANWDNGGTLTPVGGGINSATNQRIFITPAGQVIVAYGQQVYPSLAAAVAGIGSENFIVDPVTNRNLQLLGTLSVIRSATALNNTAQAIILNASKLGELSAGSAGTATTTLQGAYDNSTPPQILTDATRGALTLKRGSASDTNAVIAVQNGAGAVTARINGNGAVAGAQVNVSSATANTLARFDAAKYLTSYALVAGDIPALPTYVRRIGDTITGPIVGTTATAAPLINITTTFGDLTNAAIRGTATAANGSALHGVATGANGVGVWGSSTGSTGDGGFFYGANGSDALRSYAVGGGDAGRFEGNVKILGTTTLASSLTGILKANAGVVSVADTSDFPTRPYLPLAAGSGSPLTGVLYGQGLNFTTTADAPITISQNLAGGFTHPFQAFNSGMVAGNQYNFDFGQSASTNNAGNFGFKYVGAGSASNYVTLGLYGANDLMTITAAGVPKFSGLATAGFVRANASGQLSSSPMVAGDIPALSYQPLENQRLSTTNSPTFAAAAIGGVQLAGYGASYAGLWGGSVATRTNLNYALLTDLLGTSAGINGTASSVLAVNGGAIVTATTSGATLAGTTTLSSLAGSTTRIATISPEGQIGAASTFPLTGVTDGSSASSGIVGEIISASASGTSFTGTTAGVSLVSISLPAGSWLVWGSAHITNGASPLGLSVYLSYSSTGTTYINANTSFGLGYPVANSGITCHNIPTPINSSSTATVYLIGSEVTTGAVAVNNGATIYAQRIR